MSKFRVGMRVRILWCRTRPEFGGMETTITDAAELIDDGLHAPWWGYGVAIHPHFRPAADQLAPTYDGNTLVSWDSMRELWVPGEIRTKENV